MEEYNEYENKGAKNTRTPVIGFYEEIDSKFDKKRNSHTTSAEIKSRNQVNAYSNILMRNRSVR